MGWGNDPAGMKREAALRRDLTAQLRAANRRADTLQRELDRVTATTPPARPDDCGACWSPYLTCPWHRTETR